MFLQCNQKFLYRIQLEKHACKKNPTRLCTYCQEPMSLKNLHAHEIKCAKYSKFVQRIEVSIKCPLKSTKNNA